jgi:hypothetical protein
MNNFYDPHRTFLDLVQGYSGDMEDAWNLFSDAWSLAVLAKTEDRTIAQAMGVTPDESVAFSIGDLSIPALLQKYGKAAASLSH